MINVFYNMNRHFFTHYDFLLLPVGIREGLNKFFTRGQVSDRSFSIKKNFKPTELCIMMMHNE